jgi:hypothetical protein
LVVTSLELDVVVEQFHGKINNTPLLYIRVINGWSNEMHKSLKKMSKYERANLRQEKLKAAMAGAGKYRFKNNTSGELDLPKMPLEGARKIPKNGEFLGDSYFLQMLKTNDLKLVAIIEDKDAPMADKLITEQPPVVTDTGKVEFVVNDPKKKKLNEQDGKGEKQPDVLLTEDPMGGVVIVD